MALEGVHRVPGATKIKGGKWTVIRFFMVSLGFSIGWMAVSSELGYFKKLYGPQVLLQMNIAYFLPSIPLLVVSSRFDEPLDRRFGVTKTILIRLLLGLSGCAVACALFPFEPVDIRWLLCSIVALGLFSGVAFSAAYQMVARFANKNTISLGLGCVGSGVVILVLELAFQLALGETYWSFAAMFIVSAAFVVVGLLAALSLLLRHWSAIEASANAGKESGALTQPLLDEEAPREEYLRRAHSLEEPPTWTRPPLNRGFSTSTLINFSALDPFQTVSEGHDVYDPTAAPSITFRGNFSAHGGTYGVRGRFSGAQSFRERPAAAAQLSPKPQLRRFVTTPATTWKTGPTSAGGSPGSPPFAPITSTPETAAPAPASTMPARVPRLVLPASTLLLPQASSAPLPERQSEPAEGTPQPLPDSEPEHETPLAPAAEVAAQIWPAMAALFFSGTTSIFIFPFFTYIPSSGLMGEYLPRALFFLRLFSDLLGRSLPRLQALQAQSLHSLAALGLVKAATVPFFLAYLKSPPYWHTDVGITVYILLVWGLGGYINTNAYMVGPKRVEPHLRAGAAGLMAITYQTAHCTGLIAAVFAALAIYGKGSMEG